MQGVRFQRLTFVLAGDPAQHGGPVHVHEQRDEDDAHAPPRGGNFRGVEKEPVDRLMDDPAAGDEQEDGFGQRRKVFDLAVAVGMGLVRRPGGHAHGKEGDARRHQIKAAVQGFGEDAEAVCSQPGHELDDRQEKGPAQGRQGCVIFFGVRIGMRDVACHFGYSAESLSRARGEGRTPSVRGCSCALPAGPGGRRVN